MWSREKLLHPATAIALVALFVSLGGVTYAAATIGTNQLKNGAVTNAKLGNNSVGGSKLRRGAVTVTKIGRGAVRGDKIAREGVTARELQRGSVSGAILADNAVTNAKIGLSAVTSTKLADGSVGGAKLADRGIAGAKLADGAVTSDKLGDGAVTAAKLAPGAAVGGSGQLVSARVALRDGAAAQPLLTLPAVGTIVASCIRGDTTIVFRSVAGTVREVQFAAQADRAVSSVERTDTGTLTLGPVGAASATWQAVTDAHVATVWTTSGPAADDCVVTAQALTS